MLEGSRRGAAVGSNALLGKPKGRSEGKSWSVEESEETEGEVDISKLLIVDDRSDWCTVGRDERLAATVTCSG